MIFSTFQIYLWAGLFVLGLADLYLARYPLFHPIVLCSAAGWIWGSLSNGLIVGSMLELIFGLAQEMDKRKLMLVMYAGGMAIYINKQTFNINLLLSLTVALVLAIGLQLIIERLADWLKCLVLFLFSGAFVFMMPLGQEMFGLIPAELLNQIAIAGEIIPWIFFAFATVGLISRQKGNNVLTAIPAILAGSILSMKSYFWGPIIFVFIYYLLDAVMKDRNVKLLWWLNWGFLIIGAYFLLPSLSYTMLAVFGGVLLFNILLVLRNFDPLEIYLLIFVAGVILSKGGLLS